jgi:diguanylate cyclase (GGDEF)-like protein/PAS domain S-box-containing protein
MLTRPAESPALTQLRALAGLAELVGAAAAQDQLIEQVVHQAAHLVGDAAMVWLLPTGEDRLVCVAASHPDPAGRELLAEIRSTVPDLETGPIRAVVATGAQLVVDGFDATGLADAHPGYPRWMQAFGTSCVAVLPMRTRGRVVGALVLSRDGGNGEYDDDDIVFMQALADVAAAGLDIARLVTDSTAALDELRRQSELVDHVSDAVIVLDAEQRVVSWNAAAERIYGYSPGEVLGGDLFALLATEYWDIDGGPTDRERVVALAIRSGGWSGELRERRADGSTVQTLASFSELPDGTGGPSGIVVVNRDITEQRHKEHLATHDALTGLPNRRVLSDCLRRAMDGAARADAGMAVLYLDLNGFKAVNDELGHDAGDEVLRLTARGLGGLVRGNDVVIRLGGDEFVVIAGDVGADGAELLGHRLLAGLSAPMTVAGRTVTVPPSIGIALSVGTEEPDELLRAADAAMYEAKQRGCGVAFATVKPARGVRDDCPV